MKIYVSAGFGEQKRVRAEASKLWEEGHQVTSSWLHETAKPAHMSDVEWDMHLAYKDVAEVAASDLLILDLTGPSTTGGRYVEFGVASHPTSTVLRWTVGKDTRGCFNRLAHRHFKTWAEVHDALRQ